MSLTGMLNSAMVARHEHQAIDGRLSYSISLTMPEDQFNAFMVAIATPQPEQAKPDGDWIRVQDKLPRDGQDVLMAWEGTGTVMQGKYFDGKSMLNGFAIKKTSYYVGKIGVTHWMPTPALAAGISVKE